MRIGYRRLPQIYGLYELYSYGDIDIVQRLRHVISLSEGATALKIYDVESAGEKESGEEKCRMDGDRVSPGITNW